MPAKLQLRPLAGRQPASHEQGPRALPGTTNIEAVVNIKKVNENTFCSQVVLHTDSHNVFPRNVISNVSADALAEIATFDNLI